MKTVEKYKLIDGTFSVEEAEKILTMLFNYKIDFHNREDFSNHVRFNKNIENSKKRILELIETKDAIKKSFADLKSENVKLSINSTIHVTIEK